MKKRHGVLTLLTSLAVLTYLDRMCIGALGPTMQDELDLSPKQWGWVTGAFTLAYGALEIPSGAWGDRHGQRRVLTRIVLWWSLFTALTGAVSGFLMLVLVRFLFGAGEAGAFPNLSGSASRWFPAGERGRVQGLIWGASRIGAAAAPLLVFGILALCELWQPPFASWRAPFWVFGSLGIVWALVWNRYYHDDPRVQPGIDPRELQELQTAATSIPHYEGIPWGRIFRAKQLWLIMLMWSCYVWGSTFYLGWLQTYLEKGRGFSREETHTLSALPFLVGALANPLGGVVSDRLSQRFGLKIGRRLVGCTSLVISSGFILATSLTEGKWTALVLLILGFGVLDFMLATAWAICMDVGGKYAGAVSGAMNSFGHIGATTCTVSFGYLVEAGGDYDRPLLLIAGMVLVSAGLFAFIDPSQPLVGEVESGPEKHAADLEAARIANTAHEA